MKKQRFLKCVLLFSAFLLLGFFPSDKAKAGQMLVENQTVLQDPTTQGTPDPNNSFVWPIDLFAENIDPLNNGWVKTGNGTVQRIETPAGSNFYCMQATTSEGLAFKLQFPRNTDPPINSRKKYIVFSFRSTSAFALEARIQVKTPGDTLKDKIIRYLPEDSSNYSIGDTLLVIAIGSAYKGNSFKTLSRNMERDMQTFFSTYKFQALNSVYVRGQVDVSGVQTWSRYYFIEGYADSTSMYCSPKSGLF